MPLMIAKDLHKTYTTGAKPLEVLRGVDLELQAGESLAILGASGAGKSTLLHVLGTLDPPSKGTIHYDGQSLFDWSERKLSAFRNKTIGFVFQFHHLLPMLTAAENTMLPRLISGEARSLAMEKAKELLTQVGLAGRMEHRPSELSGGEQQRVAVARALVMEPSILLADEPTGNLDSKTGKEVSDLLMELKDRRGMTLVVVTHNESLAERFQQRVYLSDGKLLRK